MTTDRADGHSKLVYDKATRTIKTVDPHPETAHQTDRDRGFAEGVSAACDVLWKERLAQTEANNAAWVECTPTIGLAIEKALYDAENLIRQLAARPGVGADDPGCNDFKRIEAAENSLREMQEAYWSSFGNGRVRPMERAYIERAFLELWPIINALAPDGSFEATYIFGRLWNAQTPEFQERYNKHMDRANAAAPSVRGDES